MTCIEFISESWGCEFWIAGVEGALQRLKPHQEGFLLPIIQEYRRTSHSVEGSMKQKEDDRVDFIASLVANDSAGLSDESIMAVAIVSAVTFFQLPPSLLSPFPVLLMKVRY